MNGKHTYKVGALQVDATALDTQETAESGTSVSLRRRLRRCWWHLVIRQITLLSEIAIASAGWIGRKRRPIGPDGCEIMLTGRFDSDNWILAHLAPLSASKECARLWMVSTNPVPALPKVVAVYPPRVLIQIMGPTMARLLTFMWAAMRNRPHVVGGFHLILNGITAAAVGRLAGARSIYFCVGGPTEVREGGVNSNDNPFAKMETPDAVVEKRLIRMVSKFDTIITMGTKAVTFFREHGIETDFHVVSGGIDSERFCPDKTSRSIDLILTGRLADIKRIDVFLHAVQLASNRMPEINAVILGDGELRNDLKALAADLDIEKNVTFAGHQEDIEAWLRRAKIFVLTSDSEGLSLAMMEAMMGGLPAVVSDVGDLGDLVSDGVSGYLVPRRSPEQFASRFVELLSDEPKRHAFSLAARQAALAVTTDAAIQHWDDIIALCWRSPNQVGPSSRSNTHDAGTIA